MTTIEVNLYHYSELSDQAKEKVREWWNDGNPDAQMEVEEASGALTKFCEQFGVNLKNWEPETAWMRFRLQLDEDVLNLSGARAVSYFWNNHPNLWKGKYRTLNVNHPVKHPRITSKTFKNGNTHNAYHSAVFIERNESVFTGTFYDTDICKPIWDFCDCPGNESVWDILNACLSALAKSTKEAIEYRYSDEAIAEIMEYNEYDFTENGKLWKQ